MYKKTISFLLSLCLMLALLPGTVFALDELGEIEAARKAIDAKKDTAVVYNDMVSEAFLSSIAKLLPDGSSVQLSFSKESDYRVYNASSTKDGSIFANILFTCGPYTKHEMYDIKIPMLTGEAAANNADAEKIAEDRAAVSEVFKGVSFDNSITQEELLEKVRAAVKNGSTVEWADGFTKVESTVSKRGSIKGVLNLTLNNEKATVKVYNGLRLIDPDDSDTLPKDENNTEPENKPADDSQTTANTVNFTDVKADAYYSAAVKWAVEKNITAGTSATTFSPDDTCTRAQIITFLWRAVGSPKATTENPFSDVKESDYYYDAAIWASEKGMVSGSTFDANTPCTRASTVTYLWKNANSPQTVASDNFADVSADADYAEAVAWAVKEGVTSGTSDTTFSPDTICSRGQIVTFLNRAIQD